MVAYIFAWLLRNWTIVLFWSVFAAALTCCVVGGILTWREWQRREMEASE